MAVSGFATKQRLVFLHLLCWGLLSSALSQYTDPNPQCTSIRRGLPACNFDKTKCYKEQVGDGEPAWTRVNVAEEGPYDQVNGVVIPNNKGYIYLDPATSEGKARKMTAKISPKIQAVCVDFNYATAGSDTVPINIYIQTGATFSPAHKIEASTGGKWESTSFSCCLPDVENEKQFAIEATSTTDGIAAIDDMDIRISNMPCENGELVCYPGQRPLEPVNAPKCLSNLADSRGPSCEFNTDDKQNLDTCGWQASSGWSARQKRDGTGQYDVIYSNETDASLLNNIDDDVEAFCVEIQFAVPDIEKNPRNLFSLYIVTQTDSLLLGESHNYYNEGDTVWKRNIFEAVLPEKKDRKIQLISGKKGLQIDYIHIRKSSLIPPPPTEPQRIDTYVRIFTCPLISEGLIPPVCGMTAVPALDTTSNLGWTEAEPEDTSKSIFPGREHYLVYSGTGKSLNDTAASLTTKVLPNYRAPAGIAFSYALSGNAKLEIVVQDKVGSEELVWSTDDETARQWVSFTVYADSKKAEDVRVTFRVLPKNNTPDRPVYVGFADIQITHQSGNVQHYTVAPKFRKPRTTESTTTEKAQTSNRQGGSSGSSAGVIVGYIFGVLIGLALIGGAVWWFYFRNRNNSEGQSRYVEKMEIGSTQEPHFIENVTYTA